MSFSVPTPCIIPLRVPVFGEHRNLNTDTKIELLCETDIPNVEIFYTLDGTKPQPYQGIVQGSKVQRYVEPFCLPAGKITVKAMAIQAQIHSMCSSVITKCFRVDSANIKLNSAKSNSNKGKPQKQRDKLKLENKLCTNVAPEEKPTMSDDSLKFVEEEMFPESDKECRERIQTLATPAAAHYLQLESEESIALDVQDKDTENSSATYIIESEENSFCEEESPDNQFKEVCETGSSVLDNTETVSCDLTLMECHNCDKCDMPLQRCFSCHKVNAIISKYCVKCGEKLVQECAYCKEQNPSIAIFCQYCGKKMGHIASFQEVEKELPENANQSVMAKPDVKSFSAQKSPSVANKSVQTNPVISKKNLQVPDFKKLPLCTAGNGYWRQQIDYICNHLKAHAYNNLEFRKLIGEPSLHQFLSANIYKEEEKFVVKLDFSSMSSEKLLLNGHSHKLKD